MMRFILAVAAALLTSGLQAQSFPERPVKIIVPFTPAGSSDIVARAMADGATEALGQPVVVENTDRKSVV